MTTYEVGDHVLIRAKVVKVAGADVGVLVELFSKTDQYDAWVRPDLITGKTAPPAPPEPDRTYVVVDREGDLWRWEASRAAWCYKSSESSWANLCSSYSPLEIYERVS